MLNLHNLLSLQSTFSKQFIPIFFIALSSVFSLSIIKIFKKYHIFQPDRKEILEIHGKEKRSLITMGGLAIFATMNIYALFFKCINFEILILGNLFGVLGLYDDYLKLKTKNSKGLLIKIRVFIAILISGCFSYYIISQDPTRNYIPIINNINFFHNIFWAIVWGVIVILASANSYNLTDGVDSLVSTLAIYNLLFIVIKLKFDIFSLPMILIFAIIGFLIFNWPPAKLIMGDIGALGIGSMIGGFFYKYHLELFLPFVGLVFVIETISVIIQIYYIRVLKKKFFLISPLHHHFEKKGWKKYKILLFFNLIGILTLILGILK